MKNKSKNTYGYKVTIPAPFKRNIRTFGNRGPKIVTHEVDVAFVTHFIYGQKNVEQAKETLVKEIANIRKTAGVNLAKGDIARALKYNTITFERVKH